MSDKEYSRNELRDQIMSLLIAASDTTLTLLGGSLMYLAMNQEIQDNAYDEIQEIFKDSEVDYERLNNLRYLEKILKESLRLFGPAPVIVRETIEDCDLGVGSNVKEGTNVYIFSHILHRRKDIWGENANKFDPENFSDEKVAQRDYFSFVPFGSVSINIFINFLFEIFHKFNLICRVSETALVIDMQ